MNDYEFGKKIYELRKSANLSQKELGKELGISDKAVSKWENGEGYPSPFQLVNISELFDVSIDSLLKLKSSKDKVVHKIVLTGGPCAGKSTALSWIQSEFTKRGYCVLIVPETATELILAGLAPQAYDSMISFEKNILSLQLEKEKIFEDAVKHMPKYNKFLIVCDRGTMDCKAYMSDLQFKKCLNTLGTNEVSLRDDYDAVFHLVSAAIGAEEHYNLDNAARQETKEQAIEQDKKTLNSWIGHPHLRVIDNSSDFKEKILRLLKEISLFLGEPEPYEIERKFLIEMPNVDKLNKMENCSKVDIVQTYLKVGQDEEMRVRQRGQNGQFTYTKTTKRKVSDTKRIETETRITAEEYLNSLLESNGSHYQITKTRYCLMYKNQYFEIDIYPFMKDKAIMEIELNDENQKIDFPKFIKIVNEVTGKKEFTNCELAQKQTLQLEK